MNYSELSLQCPHNSQSDYWSDSLTTAAPSSVNSISSDAPSLYEDNSSVTSDPSTVSSSATFPTIKFINSLNDSLSTAASWPIMSTNLPIKLQNNQHSERGSPLKRSGRFPNQDRPSTFVDSLVDSSANMVEAIWPLSAIPHNNGFGYKEIIPLREFIQETIHRSGTSYSTLQVTLYYLILIKPHVFKQEYVIGKSSREDSRRALLCGRRMFVSALILASKYLQDRNFTAQAWSKISGLDVLEINKNEITFLLAVDWQLHITEAIFQRWAQILSRYFSKSQLSTPSTNIPCSKSSNWKSMIIGLSPQLENFNSVVNPLISTTISTLQSSYFNSGSMRQKSFGLQTSESCLTTFQPIPKISDLLSSGHATYKTALALGLQPTSRLTPQNSCIKTPCKSVSSEFGKLQNSSYANPDSLRALTLSCNDLITRQEFASRSCASLYDTMSQTPTLDISLSEHLDLANSHPSSPPLKTFMLPTGYISSPLNAAPLTGLRYTHNHSRRKIFGLNKKKLENNKNNCFETNSKNLMSLRSDTCLGRGIIDSNNCMACREAIHPLKISCQYPTMINCCFGPNPYSDISTNIGSNPNRHRDLLGESHMLLLSKKRSGADSIHSPSICGIDEMKFKYSTSDTSAPRKRLCWAFEASTSINNNLYPTLGAQNGLSQLK